MTSSPGNSTAASSDEWRTTPSSAGEGEGEGAGTTGAGQGSDVAASALQVPEVVKFRQKPIPRKGHSKSKRGCYNCKRRRVKCSEELPRCRHCSRNDVDCEYPPKSGGTTSTTTCTLALRPGTPLRTTPTVFALEDLRFFHHFLSTAYPPVPYGTQAIWQSMASMVHEYDFLAHSLLGLAAQHLTVTTDADYSSMALNHRVTSMRLLNETLSRPCSSRPDGDARYATILALMFQASCMPDGMIDLLVTMRGCMIISTTVMALEDSSFKDFTRESYVESFRRRISTCSTPTSDDSKGVLEEISASLRIVAPLCQSVAELKYLAKLERIVQLARCSASEACLELAISFSLTNKMTDDEFVSFTNPSNHAAQILLAHFFVLDHVIETWALGSNCVPYPSKRNVTMAWVENVASRLPASYKKFMVWPLGSVNAFRGRGG